ncbi:glutaconyl-CoA decarboxylase subunit beta [Campylobacterota bacterium]|nr:glutaconyl-CoA decarboxylase subunit beta [Campylobacterota bacterium]
MKKFLILALFLCVSCVSLFGENTVEQMDDRQVDDRQVAQLVLETQAAVVAENRSKTIVEMFAGLIESTGVYAILNPKPIEPKVSLHVESHKEFSPFLNGWGRVIMFILCFILFYLAIAKQYEPLLLLPIAFGGLLANVPIADIAGPQGLLGVLYSAGIDSGLFPLLIFMGVGAMTDFGPLLANPKTALLGGAAQFGIFGTLVLAAVLSTYTGGIIDFSLKDMAGIAIIGGADGPTSIFVARNLAPDLLGAIAVAAYSYMALVPLIQPPIMRALTTQKEREIKMTQLRTVSKVEKILFPISLITLCTLVLPDAAPLIGALCFGNLARECGVVERINETLQNSLINIVTIFLGLSVGSKLAADKFLVPETLGIVVLGLIAFSFGTAAGVIMAKIMNKFSKDPINPLIGSAGVSAVPMAARVSQKEAQKANPQNFVLMHAMGPNVSGVIGSAVAAGVLLSLF